jgi:hypothetical protein
MSSFGAIATARSLVSTSLVERMAGGDIAPVADRDAAIVAPECFQATAVLPRSSSVSAISDALSSKSPAGSQ